MPTSSAQVLGALAPVFFGHDPLALADAELGAVLRRTTHDGEELVLSHWRADGLDAPRVAAARRLPPQAARLTLDGATVHIDGLPAPAELRAHAGWLTLSTPGRFTPALAHQLLAQLDALVARARG